MPGSIDFIDAGVGPYLLVSHGIFHGSDGGERSARNVTSGLRVVAPSRFGCLGSTMPPNPTGAAQADVFVELLDHLDIDETDVMGISTGTSAAVQLALHHPERVERLVISSGNWPGNPTSKAPPMGEVVLLRPDDVAAEVDCASDDPPADGRTEGIPEDG